MVGNTGLLLDVKESKVFQDIALPELQQHPTQQKACHRQRQRSAVYEALCLRYLRWADTDDDTLL